MMNFLFCASMLQSFQGAFLRSPNSVTGKTVDINAPLVENCTQQAPGSNPIRHLMKGKQQRGRRGRQTRNRRQRRQKRENQQATQNRRQKRQTQKPRQGRGFLCSVGLGNCDDECGYINGVELTNGTEAEKFKTTNGWIKLDGSHQEFVRIELNPWCKLKLSGNGSTCDVFFDNYGDSVKEPAKYNFKDLIADRSRGKYGGIWYKAFYDVDEVYHSNDMHNCRFNQNE